MGNVTRSRQSACVEVKAAGGLPDCPVPELAETYTTDVLNTSKGMVRGKWGQFRAEVFYQPIPGDAVRTIRHLIIAALDITRFAEREGENIQVDLLGEGSYARVFGMLRVAAKVISDRERPWVHKAAVDNTKAADRLDVGPRLYGYGTVEQTLGGYFRGTVIFMERLDPLGEAWTAADTAALFRGVGKLAQVGFHNDLKLANVLRRCGQPVIIDFDLMAQWSVKVAVTSSCIEQDFRELLEPQGAQVAQRFREYYDLFALSLTLEDGHLFRATLKRLQALWIMLETPVFRPMLETFPPNMLSEVPLEVLVRVPLQGVSVSLLDLRGNLFVHGGTPQACQGLPQLVCSNGVYWP